MNTIVKFLSLACFAMLAGCTKIDNPYQTNNGAGITSLKPFNAPQVNGVCPANLNGSYIVASDGTFLGTVSSKISPKSIFNNFGNYGSKFSSTSIWNSFGTYGGKFSAMSPFNNFTSTPPRIISNRVIIGVLTTNKSIPTAINAYQLKAVCG